MSKIIHEEDYKGFHIVVDAWYREKCYDWYEKWTQVVKMNYTIIDKNGKIVKKSEYPRIIAKKKPERILFFTIQPKQTFGEQVKNGLKRYIEQIKSDIDKDLYEDEVTDGLLGSLKGI